MGTSDCRESGMSPPSSGYRSQGNVTTMRMQRSASMFVLTSFAYKHAFSVFEGMEDVESYSPVGLMCMLTLQEDMYSYVTVADDQQYKGKGTEVVDA